MVHEADVAGPAWFATLTYGPEEIPENGSLRADDVTRFLKRLRKGERLSYYYCGEYGERTDRPHYHAVLYGPEFLDREYLTTRHGAPVWVSDSLTSRWGHGLCEFTALTYAGALYVAGYVRKKVRQSDAPEHYTRVDPATGELVELDREFSRMSRRPPLGLRWIEKYWSDVYPRDFVVIDGKEFKPPRFYDKWMDGNHPGVMLEVRGKRIEEAEEVSSTVLANKEHNHRARVALFSGRDGV